jgi:hypothetical protein
MGAFTLSFSFRRPFASKCPSFTKRCGSFWTTLQAGMWHLKSSVAERRQPFCACLPRDGLLMESRTRSSIRVTVKTTLFGASSGFAGRSNITCSGLKPSVYARAESGPTPKWRSSTEWTSIPYPSLLLALRAKCEGLTSTITDLTSSLQTTWTMKKLQEPRTSERKQRTFCSVP